MKIIKYNRTSMNENQTENGSSNFSNIDANGEKDLLSKLDAFFKRHLKKIFFLSLFFTLTLGLLLFNKYISLAGDDASYIVRASDLISKFSFPGYQGPFYPIILSPFVYFFGINLIVLKSLSLFFILGFMWFTYKTFCKRISPFVLGTNLILLSLNSYILYYSSETFSEALFMFIQSILFFVFFKYFIDNEVRVTIKDNLKRNLILALLLLLLGLTRSIGFLGIAIIFMYFFTLRKWKEILYMGVTFLLILILYQGLKYILWGSSALHLSGQTSELMYKNTYNHALGKETITGFIFRFLENSNYYISRGFLAALGFFPSLLAEQDGNIFITIGFYLFFLTGIIIVNKRNKFLLFTGIYTFNFLFFSFCILHTYWRQLRLITPFIPLMLLFLTSTIYYLLKTRQAKKFQFLIILFLSAVLIATIMKTEEQVELMPQINNTYGGLSAESVNYIEASKWAAENVPINEAIACRKPDISFIYGNSRHFYGIESVPSYSVDLILGKWGENQQQYIAIRFSDFREKYLSYFNDSILTARLTAYISQLNDQFFIFKIPNETKVQFLNEIDKLAFDNIQNPENLKEMLSDSASLFYPDTLLNILCKNNVRYILVSPAVSMNSESNKFSISTISKFILYTRLKYPNLFSYVTKFGDDAPVKIMKINYEKYFLHAYQDMK